MSYSMYKLVRITTVPVSMQVLLKGQPRFMRANGFDVTLVSSPGDEVETLEAQEGCPHISVMLTRKITPFRDLMSLVQLIRILREIRPDIVHTHTPKAGLIGMWAAWFARVPVRLHTIAGIQWMETTGALRTLLKAVEKLTAWPAHRVYPNSRMLAEFLRRQKIGRGKLKVLGKGSSNGIDANHFSPTMEILEKASALRLEKNLQPGDWVWIFVGRLVKDKGLGELLDAFKIIHQQFPGDRLWLLGNEEPELDPLEEGHKEILHTHTAITRWGFQKDIRPYLAAAQVLVFPSYREGFPNVPMQAGLMGCMLLLSDINGCNEIVDTNINGILVPAKDSRKLTEQMLMIRRDPSMRKKYADLARKKITENFGQQQVWRLILDEYRYWIHEKNLKHRP